MPTINNAVRVASRLADDRRFPDPNRTSAGVCSFGAANCEAIIVKELSAHALTLGTDRAKQPLLLGLVADTDGCE
jgi:hypothetical protein